MTQISYIHGIPANERKDRAKEISKPLFIDYSVLTTGEMKAALLYEQLGIFKNYYPEAAQEYQSAQDKIINSLHTGLSGVDTATGYGELMRMVNRVLAKAKNSTKPAAGKYPGIGEVPVFTPLQGQNCEPILEELRRVRRRVFAGQAKKEVEARLEACRQQERLVQILNTNLEKSGHHILYAYAPGNVAGSYAAVATKRVLHNNAIGGFHNISKLDRELLRDWIRNGIIRYNALGGLSPLQPEQTVEDFKNAVIDNKQEGVGIDPVTVSLIIGLVATALAATVDLIKALNQQERNQLLANTQGIATPEFGPEESDFLGGGSGAGLPTWAILAMLGFGVYAISKN